MSLATPTGASEIGIMEIFALLSDVMSETKVKNEESDFSFEVCVHLIEIVSFYKVSINIVYCHFFSTEDSSFPLIHQCRRWRLKT